MDREFPSVLFPSVYDNEAPDTALGHCAGSWGSHGQLQPTTPQTSSSSFKVQYDSAGEVWRHTEPVPVPLFSPKHAGLWASKPANPLDFSEHLQNFFVDYSWDTFSSTTDFLENQKYRSGQKKKSVKLQDESKIRDLMGTLQHRICPYSRSSFQMDRYSHLLWDAVHSVPVELLGSLLHEELTQQSLEALFCEAHTGGALDFIPYTSSTEGAPQSGCLVYCANGVDKLTFQQVALQPGAVVCSGDACTFLLKGPVQQISSRSVCGRSCVAVRSMYHCGVWAASASQQPHLLQAVSCAERVSCVSVSPHVVGEQLVASESGAVHLWRLGHGMQLMRTEDSNLYFNAQSSWRWCEFSAHPRVMLYADRTGVELTDNRVQPSSCHTLFRISKAAECRSGERLLLCRYLSPLHSFHHLVTTQYSAYIMDERFPCVPMLKWDHMMDSPPVFCQVLPGSGSSTAGAAKVLLGSQAAQEVRLLQYSGGGAEACVSRGPPRALLRPRDSVEHLPIQIPHRTEASRDRLSHPATGLTAIHLTRSASKESFCVLQLLQTGDVFYQILEKASSPAESSERNEEETPLLSSCQTELQLSQESTSIWKKWLQKLARHPDGKKPSDMMEKSHLHLSISKPRDLDQRRKVQHDLKQSMCECSLNFGSTQDIEPLTVDVQTEDWTDEVSSRLTAGWDGEAAWQCWWTENLGANNEEKTRALRRKRRKEKVARRAGGHSLFSMSGSFTSSISYQSELSDPSDWVMSDSGGAESQPQSLPTQDTLDKHSKALFTGTEERAKPRPSSASTGETVRTRPALASTPETVRTRPPSASTPETVRTRPPLASTPETIKTRPPSASTPETIKTRPPLASTPETVRTHPPSASTPETVRTHPPTASTPKTIKTRPPLASTPETVRTRPPLASTPETVRTHPPTVSTPKTIKTRPPLASTPETVRTRPPVNTPTSARKAWPLRSRASQSLDPSSGPSSSLPLSSSATPNPVDSQNVFSWSQSSQRLSQSSQPRKKSRMGF